MSLLDTATLNETSLTPSAQESLKKQYRSLAYLGDALIDAILADYLFSEYPNLSQQEMDDLRQTTAERHSLCERAMELGWPDYCTSRNRKNRKPPKEEAGTYGEMFEALAAAIYIEFDRDFLEIYDWLVDKFLRSHVKCCLPARPPADNPAPPQKSVVQSDNPGNPQQPLRPHLESRAPNQNQDRKFFRIRAHASSHSPSIALLAT